MNFLLGFGISLTDLILFFGALVLAMIISMTEHVYWVTRLLISSFISLALVKILPEKLLFFGPNSYPIYFFILFVLIAVFCHYKLFDSVEWIGEGFDFIISIFVFLSFLFFISVVFHFIDYNYFATVFTEKFYNFFGNNLFYFMMMPILWAMFFSKRE